MDDITTIPQGPGNSEEETIMDFPGNDSTSTHTRTDTGPLTPDQSTSVLNPPGKEVVEGQRRHHDQARADKEKSDNEAAHWQKRCMQIEEKLKDGKRRHDQVKADHQRSQREAAHWRGQFLEATEEMDGLMHHHQVLNQVEDTELVKRTMQLRDDIRDIAIHYGGDSISYLKVPPASYTLFEKHLGISKGVLDVYLQSPSTRLAVIRAFIWRFLVDEVFGKFRWAPFETGNSMEYIYDFLDKLDPPKKHASNILVPEAKRKLNMWRANTSNLLLETAGLYSEKAYDHRQSFSKKQVFCIAKCLRPIAQRKGRDITVPLSKLLSESLALDQAFSQQVAIWTWLFPGNMPCCFDSEIMELEADRKQKGLDQDVRLVLAPALVKQGKSSGANFELKKVWVKMEVECELPVKNSEGGGFHLMKRFFSEAKRIQA